MRQIHQLLRAMHIKVHHSEDLFVFGCLVVMVLAVLLCLGAAAVALFGGSRRRGDVEHEPVVGADREHGLMHLPYGAFDGDLLTD